MSTDLPWLSRTVIRYSSMKTLIASLFLSTLVAGLTFGVYGQKWTEVANGMPVFDQLRTVSPDELFDMLALYSPEMIAAYIPMNMLDLLFPAITCAVLLILLALIMTINPNDGGNEWLLRKGIFWLLLAMPMIDWVENLSFLLLLHTYPHAVDGLLNFVSLTKLAKAAAMYSGLSAIVLILAYNLYRRVCR